MNPARISFKTVGCRLNQAETAAMRASFRAAGFRLVPFGAACDVSVIHGCAVTANAERDSLRLARSARRANRDAFIVLAGCVAEIGRECARAACGADLAAGQSEKFDLPGILRRHGVCSDGGRGALKESGVRAVDRPLLPCFETTRAAVKIQDGCDFHCSYCIVPRARGAPRSRPVKEVITEIAGLAESGYKEVVLTGANIGCYRDNDHTLVSLLKRIEALPLIERVRLSSIEVSTVERAVVDFMSESGKLCRFLHLPLQSGDPGVLRAMGRRYTVSEFRRFVEYLVAKLGPIGLGTDMIVGFPGEDGRAFAAGKRLLNELPFNNLHVFAYDSRPGTKAGMMEDDVPGGVKRQRSAELKALGRRKRASFAKSRVGIRTSVLVEKIDERGRALGWTGEYIKAGIAGAGLKPNTVIDFVPNAVEGDMLVGSIS